MKSLHIIESKTPGIDKIRLRIKRSYGKGPAFKKDAVCTPVTCSYIEKLKTTKKFYNGKKVLKIYESGWNPEDYFVRYLM
jgi:hypothetical protein